MIDGLEIVAMRREAADIARASSVQPYEPGQDVVTRLQRDPLDWENLGINIPNFGDYRPDGWELGETYFVDKTGLDDCGPALSIERFLVQMRVGLGYAMIEEGQISGKTPKTFGQLCKSDPPHSQVL